MAKTASSLPPANPMLEAALEYAGLGWRVINVYPRKKRPVGEQWQERATTDVDQIERWWTEKPECNVGVLLGPASNLIDVECDSDDQERSLAALFDGEFPETPTFKGARGKHRLFQWRDDLPAVGDKGIVYIGEVGWRTGGGSKAAQSVFPPSIHESGIKYEWLIHPSQCEVARLSDDLVLRLTNHDGGLFSGQTSGDAKPPEYWQKIMEGVTAGHRNQSAAELIGRLFADLKDPFDNAAVGRVWAAVEAWNARNSPPIASKELRTTFGSILRRHRESVASEESGKALERYVEHQSGDGGGQAAWRLVRIDSKPVTWKLFAPIWGSCKSGGFLQLPTESLGSYTKIFVASLEQTGIWLGPDFKKLWLGTRKEEGLGSKLARMAEIEEPQPEERRDAVVADIFLQIISGCKTSDKPDYRGIPTRDEDGNVVFKVQSVVGRMQEIDRSVTSAEVVALQRECGAVSRSYHTTMGKTRLKVLSPLSIKKIEQIARISDVEEK